MQVIGGRQITVMFNADTGATMPWKFVPQQRAVKVGTAPLLLLPDVHP